VVAHAVEWLKQRPTGHFSCGCICTTRMIPTNARTLQDEVCVRAVRRRIAYEDFAVGTLLQQLKTSGLYDGAMIAVMPITASRWGAWRRTHGVFLYDETIQVPLLIKLPLAARRKSFQRRSESIAG